MLRPCDITPLHLAASLRTKKNFVWLDSLVPQASFPEEPLEEGLSLLAAEPDLILEGGPNDWPLLEQELKNRLQSTDHRLEDSEQQFKKNQPSQTEGNREQALRSKATTNCELPTTNYSCEAGAAIGFFRYDGSFCFGFYETVYRHHAIERRSHWLTKPPSMEITHAVETILQESLQFQSDLTAQEYCTKVCQAQEHIAAGNVYQVCLAHRFTAPCTEDPWPLYLALRKKSPAPFAAYLQLGQETVLSSSPECFLKMQGRHIVTRPIKGTRPRRSNPEEDKQQAFELKASLKENAELIMITDLERNDLGKVCDYGSVVTSQLLELERYPQVFHLVSTVEGRLRSTISHVKALAACFPGGSISGAPKKKAMEIIQELEPVPRGLFTGAIGYFGFDGTSQFNIAIRTLVIQSGMAQFHVGAGITSDSSPEEEWEETLHKAAGILAASHSE